MKRRVVYAPLLLALLLLAFSIPASAEVLTAGVTLTAGSEVSPNPAPPPNASGAFLVTVNVTRDGTGAVTSGTINFLGIANFPGGANITVTGLHIHEGAINANGPVRFDSGLSGTNTLTLTGGVGLINLNAASVDITVLARLLANPSGWYVNLHTSTNPGGAIRAQIVRLVETSSNTVAMSSAQEVSPPAGIPTASGTGTITVHPVRNPVNGQIVGGTVTFTITFDIPAGSEITGLHIHRGAAGTNGPVEINTGLSGTNFVATPTGKGTISYEVPITSAPADAVALKAMTDMLTNPAGFYTNLHTRAFGGGLIRAQNTSYVQPLVVQQSSAYFVETGSTDTQIRLLLSSTDLLSIPTAQILINGQQVTAPFDLATGSFNVTIPSALRANAGTLFVQARNASGLMSAPVQIVVAPTASVNTQAIVSVDAAQYGQTGSPDTIIAGFGTKLASQAVAATRMPLPYTLDGTSVYINGIPAPLFFVSGFQTNYLLPESIPAGPAAVNVVAKDGTVSRGQIIVAQSSPSIFTITANGQGAPAAVASADGMNFNILMGNPDGTPREISAGNFVMLFGTGLRFGSTGLTNAVKIGTTDVTPTFIGLAPGFAGLQQCNLQIPQSLAGAGDVNLTITMDGKTSNVVKLRIKAATAADEGSDNP